jgi:hypothetical protein
MFGDAVLQGEELSQPGFFGFSVFFDVFPAFGKGHDGQQGDNDNLYQRIRLVSFYSGVLDMLEKVE